MQFHWLSLTHSLSLHVCILAASIINNQNRNRPASQMVWVQFTTQNVIECDSGCACVCEFHSTIACLVCMFSLSLALSVSIRPLFAYTHIDVYHWNAHRSGTTIHNFNTQYSAGFCGVCVCKESKRFQLTLSPLCIHIASYPSVSAYITQKQTYKCCAHNIFKVKQ